MTMYQKAVVAKTVSSAPPMGATGSTSRPSAENRYQQSPAIIAMTQSGGDQARQRPDETGDADQQHGQRGDGQHLRPIDPGGAVEELPGHDLADDLGVDVDARHGLAQRRDANVLQARGGDADQHDRTCDLLRIGFARQDGGGGHHGNGVARRGIEAELAALVGGHDEVGDAQRLHLARIGRIALHQVGRGPRPQPQRLEQQGRVEIAAARQEQRHLAHRGARLLAAEADVAEARGRIGEGGQRQDGGSHGGEAACHLLARDREARLDGRQRALARRVGEGQRHGLARRWRRRNRHRRHAGPRADADR